MTRDETRALLLSFASLFRARGSWCGETHLQKALYFLKALAGVPLPFDFVLWKHGPYSFDLHDELAELLGYGLLAYEVRIPQYGPSLVVTDTGRALLGRETTHQRFASEVEFVATRLADKGVLDLEKVGTALLVTQEMPCESAERRATRLNELKPHVPVDQALEAVDELDAICAAWRA